MLFSVITVAWNAAATIDATCLSVDMQTHPDIEHLVIDGQSTDDTLEVLARRPSSKRKVFSEPDDGLYDAMNKGLARAGGDIVVFLNADDRYRSPTVLADVHRAFVETGADAVHADIDMVIQTEPTRVQRRWRSGPYKRWKVLLGWQVPHPALFIRRTVLQRIGTFDASYGIAADYELMLRLVNQDGVRLQYLPLTVVEMAVGGVSTSGIRATWRGYLESARALKSQAGIARYLIAAAKPAWKLPQLMHGRAATQKNRDGEAAGVVEGTSFTAGSPRGVELQAQGLRPLHVGKFVPPPFAGIESHVDTLLRAMSTDVDATLAASEPSKPSPVRRQSTPYRIVSSPSYGTIASVAISPGIRKLIRQEFDQGRANLLHVHAPNPWGDLATLDAHRDTPVIMTWHSDVVGKPILMSMYAGIQRRALQRADRIVVFTPKHYESSRQLQAGRLESKIVHIPIGVDFERLDHTPPCSETAATIDAWARGRPLLLTVGRQVRYKGYHHLINTMTRIRSDAVLLFIGAGPLSEPLRKQVAESGLDERVRFLGEVAPSVLVTALRRCDIFCLPSVEQSEAFGIASAEAMGFAKPTVVCELGNGVNHLNRAGVTSLVTAPRDEAALAEAIDQLAMNPALRDTMGRAARDWVRSEFSVSAMRDATLKLYRSLV